MEKKTDKPILGKHPENNENIYFYKAKYGPVVQLGDVKPKYKAIPSCINMEDITLQQAIHLLSLPKKIGTYENKDICLNVSKNGFYIQYNDKNYGLETDTVTQEQAIEKITNKMKTIIKNFSKNISIRNGPYGPYILKSGKIVVLFQFHIRNVNSLKL